MAEQPSNVLALARRDVAALSDTGLLIAIVRRHDDALAEVYDRHGASVYRFASRLFGLEQAEEVTEEVFLALWRIPEEFHSDGSSLRSSLLAEAHRRGVHRARIGTKCRGSEAKASPSKDVRNLLSNLPDAERMAISLACFGGCTYRQVAALVHQPEEVVKGNINAALCRLRSLLR